IERNHSRTFSERLVRTLVFSTFPRPDRLRLMRWPLLAYQKSGAKGLLRRSGLLNRLPVSLRAMESLMPALTRKEKTASRTPAVGVARKRVGLLLGCVQRE